MNRIKGTVEVAKECDHCREALYMMRTEDDRVVATDQRNGLLHICFDIPADANLLVMRNNGN